MNRHPLAPRARSRIDAETAGARLGSILSSQSRRLSVPRNLSQPSAASNWQEARTTTATTASVEHIPGSQSQTRHRSARHRYAHARRSRRGARTKMPQVQRRSVEGDRPGGAKKSTLATIQAMERAREERRQQMEARKDRKEREKLSNAEKGVVGDVDFVRMISAWREANKDQSKPHATFSTNEAEKNAGGAICICVRKRPISRREVSNKDHDAVSCVHPSVVVHDCRLRVDGISKYLNNQQFAFDHAFSENEDTAEIYRCWLGVSRCCGAFTPSTRVVSGRRGRGWFLFRF